MGILNVTPDSFSDGGAFNETDAAMQHIAEMVAEGADIIDVGGESTRPGSDPVAAEEESNRVIPILERAIPAYPDTFFSVDTTKYTVAEEALKLGAHFINDVSGMQKEPRLANLCAEYEAGYILMHSQGDPKTMQQDPTYDDVVNDLYLFFKEQVEAAQAKGVERLIIDPGIGFGKTLQHNTALIRELKSFQSLDCPILVGASRKSMIGEILNDRTVDDRLIGTIAVHYHALINGANIIRVHDVKEARDSLAVFNALSAK
ncbi:dihydropteroate synthase [Aliifodinibius sp. 1BSP15-2V2]|uniref:dihydropteroate synthase n=2 Tax=Fodinibius salsisoli TaxID=2820877 RepID=A0ABT3PSC6_9BACT|nr:dihydropteroate synthase [Fodinibius salsisoli]